MQAQGSRNREGRYNKKLHKTSAASLKNKHNFNLKNNY